MGEAAAEGLMRKADFPMLMVLVTIIRKLVWSVLLKADAEPEELLGVECLKGCVLWLW